MSTGPVPPQLVVVDGRMRGASFDVPPERSEIGRQAGVAILLDDQDVSRRHAVLERAGGRVVLTDPGSTNGTWVNRRRLRAGDPGDRVELRDGDEVRLGSVTLRFSTARPATGPRPGSTPSATSTGRSRPGAASSTRPAATSTSPAATRWWPTARSARSWPS
jgi:pSer/pThr/pTyr-binding forkhead associated (FHA) protein